MDFKTLFNLDGRCALVTGSSRGIGNAIATALAEAGASVIVHGSRKGGALDAALEAIKAKGGKAAGVAADIGDSAGVASLVSESKAAFGHVDILVLNASIQSYQFLEDFTEEEFFRQYNANLKSSFELIKAFLPGMKERSWGRVLSIGSVNQWKPSPKLPIYASSKAALANLVLNCARESSKYGVTANNLAPGVILTDRNREALGDKEYSDKILSMIPAGRFGNVADCAGLALLLCSDAGGYITGADIPVDGGMGL